MTRDILDKKIIEIKKRGLPQVVQENLIKEARKEYYETYFRKKLSHLGQQFAKNVQYLGKLHGNSFHSSQIYQTMGIFINHKVFMDALNGKSNISSMFIPLVAAEFFGLPVEYLLFYDLQTYETTLKEKYPALYRQGRD